MLLLFRTLKLFDRANFVKRARVATGLKIHEKKKKKENLNRDKSQTDFGFFLVC